MFRYFVASLSAVALLSASCGKSKPDCQGGAVVCGGVCVELSSDNLNCGGCGNACPQGMVCSSGACALTCAPGLVNCGGKCIDPMTDRAFCGASGSCSGAQAGTVCAAGEVCSAGSCSQSWPVGEFACGGKCIDPMTDTNYCGAASDCGVACGPSAFCYTGSCWSLCAPGLVFCDGSCIDPLVDPTHCGASGYCTGPSAGAACLASQACTSGVCTPVCTWELVASYDLTAAPAGSVQKNGAMNGQGPAIVAGRMAWSQTSDWNMLFIPTGLAPGDDVFAVETEVYIAYPTTSDLYAAQMLFSTTGTAPALPGASRRRPRQRLDGDL